MIFTRNVSCDSSQTDINTIEPTLSFYIKLKTAHFFIKGRIQRSICMHKMDYIWYKCKEQKRAPLKWFCSCIFWWPPWSHFHYFFFWYACPMMSRNLLNVHFTCMKFNQKKLTYYLRYLTKSGIWWFSNPPLNHIWKYFVV